jgi:hypothetical protein
MRMLALAFCFACAAPAMQHAHAQGLKPLSDDALADVRGRDGVSFDLSGFAMSGNARATFTAAPGRSIWMENLSASRSDSAMPFSDPYRLDIVDGITRSGGSFVISDLVFYGGGWQFSTPRVADGVAFGAALRMDIGQLALRPAGRDNAGEQLALQGIRIGAVDENGNFTGAPWKIADVASQPAIINAVADENGPRLHIGIDWPDAKYGSGQAATGGIQIDKISFTSPTTGITDLGSSRIGSVQIQYLDIKFRQ